MDEPDYLDVGGRPPRRRTVWLTVAVAVLVVGGLGAARVAGLDDAPTTPDPNPPRSAPPSASTRSWPVDADLPAGTLYAIGDDGAHAIDMRSGLVVEVGAGADLEGALLAPLVTGVLAWSPDRGPKPVLISGVTGIQLAPGSVFDEANVVVPGVDGQVWLAKLDWDDLRRTSRYTLVDGAGATLARTSLGGYPFPDGSGGLFSIDAGSIAHVYPGPVEKQASGEVLATGPDGYVRSRCVRDACSVSLHDRLTGTDTVFPGLQAQVESGVLSTGNRFVVGVTPGGERQSVREVASGLVVRSLPDGGDSQGPVWVSDHWVAAVTNEGLALYDTATDRLVVTTLPFDNPTQIVWSPSG